MIRPMRSTTTLAMAAALAASLVACSDSTSVPGAATILTLSGGDAQTAIAGASVTVPPSVRVTDVNGRGVNGVEVTFAVGSGDGAIVGATQTTFGDGVAAVGSWTLGATPGVNTLTATADGLVGSPLTFTATGLGVAYQYGYGLATGTGGTATLPSLLIEGENRLLMCVVSVEPYNSAVTATAIVLDDGAGGGAQAFTQLGTSYSAPSDGLKWATYFLVAPTLGARRFVVTLSGSTNWGASCMSYTGVNQAAPFGIVATNAGAAGAAGLTVVSNATASLPWAHLVSSNAGFAAGTGVTVRQATSAGASSAMVDGNARYIVTGAHGFNWTYAGQFAAQGVMIRPALVP